jgi:hypothetical protein
MPRYGIGEKVATRKAYGEGLAALGSVRGDIVALDGEAAQLERPPHERVASPLGGLHDFGQGSVLGPRRPSREHRAKTGQRDQRAPPAVTIASHGVSSGRGASARPS